MEKQGVHVGEDTFDRLFDAADKNKDGKICIREFKNALVY
jgi:Ca2+-binding EF-hand superfamily protein